MVQPIDPRSFAAISAVIKREGGYVDHPADRGGPTNMGITIKSLERWRGHPVTIEDVQALDPQQAAQIYQEIYITAPGFDRIISTPVFDFVVDMSAHHGSKNATKILQKALGDIQVDGIFGPKTERAVNLEPISILDRLRWERALFCARIVREDPTQAVHLVGWLKRCGGLE